MVTIEHIEGALIGLILWSLFAGFISVIGDNKWWIRFWGYIFLISALALLIFKLLIK